MSETEKFYYIVEESVRETRDRYVCVEAHNEDGAKGMLNDFIDRYGVDELGTECMNLRKIDGEVTGTYRQGGAEEGRHYFVIKAKDVEE